MTMMDQAEIGFGVEAAVDVYAFWRAMLAHRLDPSKPRPLMAPDDPQPGCYRWREQNGTLHAVRYYFDDDSGEFICEIDGEEAKLLKGIAIWIWCGADARSEEELEAVLAGKPWSDEDAPATAHVKHQAEQKKLDKAAADVPAADRVVERSDNLPPTVSPLESFRAEVLAAKEGHKDFAAIVGDDRANQAQARRDMYNNQRNAADKIRDALVRPLNDEVKRINAAWNPLIKEMEGYAVAVRTSIEDYRTRMRDAERKRLADEEAKRRADAAAAEALRLAAERAAEEARKKHEQEVREAEANEAEPPPPPPPPPPPAFLAQPRFEPAAAPRMAPQIKGATGKAASEKVVWEVNVLQPVDWLALLTYLQERQELRTLALKLANQAAAALTEPKADAIPGVTLKEKVKIR